MTTETTTDGCGCGSVAIAQCGDGIINFNGGSGSGAGGGGATDGTGMGGDPVAGSGGDGTFGGQSGTSSPNGVISGFRLECINGDVYLSWQSSATEFNIYLNGALLGSTTENQFIDSVYPPSTATYKICTSGPNPECASNTINPDYACVTPDNGSIGDLRVECVSGQIVLKWADTAATPTAPYVVSKNGTLLTSTSNTSFVIVGGTPGRYEIKNSIGEIISTHVYGTECEVDNTDTTPPDTETEGWICTNVQTYTVENPPQWNFTKNVNYPNGFIASETWTVESTYGPLPEKLCLKKIWHADAYHYPNSGGSNYLDEQKIDDTIIGSVQRVNDYQLTFSIKFLKDNTKFTDRNRTKWFFAFEIGELLPPDNLA